MNSSREPAILQMRVRELEPGLILARPVDSAEGCRLLPKDTRLDHGDIERLEEWEQRVVKVYDPEDLENDSNAYAEAS